MANNVNNFPFSHFPPPHPISPPPKPHPPPPPPPRPHPPPFVPPPPSPPHSYIIIIFVFSTFGCILLGLAILSFCCYLKKKKKTTVVEEKEVKHIDEHLRIKEAIVQGPHGKPKTVVLSVEEDFHEKDDIIRTKKELEESHKLHTNKTSEITPSALEAGHVHYSSTSSSGHGHGQT